MSIPEDQDTKYENKVGYDQSTEDQMKYVHNWEEQLEKSSLIIWILQTMKK